MVSVNFTHIYIIVRDSGNGETNEKIAYFSNPNFPFTDSEPNYATYTVKVSIMLRIKTNFLDVITHYIQMHQISIFFSDY